MPCIITLSLDAVSIGFAASRHIQHSPAQASARSEPCRDSSRIRFVGLKMGDTSKLPSGTLT